MDWIDLYIVVQIKNTFSFSSCIRLPTFWWFLSCIYLVVRDYSDSGSGSSKSGSSSSKSESEKRKVAKKEPNSFRTKARRRASSELQPVSLVNLYFFFFKFHNFVELECFLLFQCWEKNPDIYGIRRSNRSRKEPERLTVESDSSERGKKKTKAYVCVVLCHFNRINGTFIFINFFRNSVDNGIRILAQVRNIIATLTKMYPQVNHYVGWNLI